MVLGAGMETNTEYHIDDRPPPTTQAPLCERLMPVFEQERAEEVIPDKHLAFDKNQKKLSAWFQKFGFERGEPEDEGYEKVPLFNKVDGNSHDVPSVTEDISQVLEHIFTRKQNDWNQEREGVRNEIIEKKAEEERLRKEE